MLRHALLAVLLALAAFAPARAQPAPLVIRVDSPVFAFSPANWTGDTGRAGSAYRQTWNPGAYFTVTWTTAADTPSATLLLDTSTYGEKIKNLPELTYCIDGVWTTGVKAADRIEIQNLKSPGEHTLVVYLKTTEQIERWGTASASGLNILRVLGLEVDATARPAAPAPRPARWALIVGDSITEGNAAADGRSDALASWPHFVGAGLQSLGYDYGVSACGYSGWLRPGNSRGDVPAYYAVSRGAYDDTRSRWNKIDARHTLLDTAGRLSAHGQPGQEPALILINYGTNDALKNVNRDDLRAAITQGLLALQKAAPAAHLVVIVPFGQYAAAEVKAGHAAARAASPSPDRFQLIDLGETTARTLQSNGYWSGLHPNMRGHATFAAQILAQIAPRLSSD